MAQFYIYNTAGTGAYMPSEHVTAATLAGSGTVIDVPYDDGALAFLDMAGSIDVLVHYQQVGSTTASVKDIGFTANGMLIGEVNGLNFDADLAKGESPLTKVLNGGDDAFFGADYADWIHGGNGNDTVFGGGNDDVLFGDNGNDVLWGEAGSDRIEGGNGNDNLFGGGNDDVLFGDNDNDVLWGEAGSDRIDGGNGIDAACFLGEMSKYQIIWGPEDDALVTDLFGDQGSDYLTNTVEHIGFADGNVLSKGVFGFHNGNFTGSSGNDTFLGASGSNTLRGGAGNDWLNGGAGSDVLYGGAGVDAFVFDTKPARYNKDAIKDFRVVDDTIDLDNAFFTKVGGNGWLKVGAFWSDKTGKAHDANDRVIYDKDSGVLNYDADGTGHGAAVAFATIGKNLALTHKDFFIL